jgi:hypothetical protein
MVSPPLLRFRMPAVLLPANLYDPVTGQKAASDNTAAGLAHSDSIALDLSYTHRDKDSSRQLIRCTKNPQCNSQIILTANPRQILGCKVHRNVPGRKFQTAIDN